MSEPHFNIEGTSETSFLRVENRASPKLCGNCHGDKANVEKTDHDLQGTAPASKNSQGQTPFESGACGACHLVHNSKNRTRLWAREFGEGSDIMERMCASCHSTNSPVTIKNPRIASHPDEKLIVNIGKNFKEKPDYFPLFHPVSGESIEVGNISCPSCHNAHQWDSRFPTPGMGVNLEGDATNSFLRGAAENLLCQDCHGPDALYRYLYYHAPHKRKNIGD